MSCDNREMSKGKVKVARNTYATGFEMAPSKTHINNASGMLMNAAPSASELKQYLGVLICGVSLWGCSWFILRDAVLPGGYLFSMASVVAVGYIFGHTLERYTTLNPVIGMTLIGALYRNLGTDNYLNNPNANTLDFHLRRIYPVIILSKGPLSWNWEYIKYNSVKVFSLATLPWIVECLSTAVFTHVLLKYPWYWGLHLGAILSSVSPAVVVPFAMAFHARGLGTKNKVAALVANAGGLDTAFTEGMFGVINSAIFVSSTLTYRIVKALLAIFIGIGIGVLWGILVDWLPDHRDIYAPTIRSLLIFFGGLLLNYGGGYLGWGGTAGVAIMVCAATAAARWSRRGWLVNNNPVSEVYKLLWRVFEPMLFTLSGYFLEVSQVSWEEFGRIVACIFLALFLRLLTAFLVALAGDFSVKESLFVAVTWIPKAIVEAVLVRVATDSLWKDSSVQDRNIAEQHSNIIVIAILITSTLGSGLTTLLGPILLSQDSRVAPEGMARMYFFEMAVAVAEKQRRKVQRRAIRDASNPFQLPDAGFHHIYRVRKEMALYICEELEEDLRPLHADGLPVYIKVLTSLHFLGDGSYQRGTGLDHGLSIAQSTVSHYLGQFVDAANRRSARKHAHNMPRGRKHTRAIYEYYFIVAIIIDVAASQSTSRASGRDQRRKGSKKKRR